MRARALAAVLAVLVVTAVLPSAGRAEFGFVPGSVKLEALGPANQPYLLAGGHPDHLSVGFEFNTLEEKADGNVKEFSINLPPGLVGAVDAVPACPRSVFDNTTEETCPPASEVGAVTLQIPTGEAEFSVYEVEAPPGGSVELGASFIFKYPMGMRLRPDDDGITITVPDLNQSLPLVGATIELWGVPADHQSGTGIARRPFLTLPTNCDPEGMPISLRARSWEEPNRWREIEATSPLPLEGCDTLAFEPEVGLELTDPQADTPTGAKVDLTVPGGAEPDSRAGAAVKEVAITLPDGVSFSPGAAPTLAACGDEAFGLETDGPAACPPNSKVGTVELVSSLLFSPATGVLYLGSEHPGERFRILGDVGVAGTHLKLVGHVQADQASGQLSLSLDDIPQLPFSRMTLRLDGGADAMLVTPIGCGAATASASLSSYNGDTAKASLQTDIAARDGGSCQGPPPLRMSFSGGARTPLAGRATALSMTLRRSDGEQMLERFSTALPLGMAARLGTIERCESAEAAAARCPASSRIGSTVAEIGSGPQPAVLRGDIYLTGPYGRAPYGLALIYDGSLGPFQLGPYLIRASVEVDPHSGRVRIATDPLSPTVAGISARFQTIGLDIDRPGLVVNPTSCRPLRFEASLHAVDGRDVATSVPFSLRRCESQAFRPQLSLGVLGEGLGREDAVGFELGLRLPRHGANLRSMRIRLPRVLRLDGRGPREICSRVDAFAGECPPGSRVGSAVARTPLLSVSLRGGVYATQPPRTGLPNLWVILRGQGLWLAVRAKTLRSEDGRAFTELVGIPDMPISTLRIRLPARGSGVFRLREPLCGGDGRSAAAGVVGMEGHDGAYRIERVPLEHRPCAAPTRSMHATALGRRGDG